MRDVEASMRQTLVELELTSTAPARVFVPVVSGSSPDSSIPTGSPSPAEHWRRRYDDARSEHERADALRGARSELAHIRRRRFAVGVVRDGDDLRERVLSEGEGAPPATVALAMRCTPTFVRRARLSSGRDAERGRVVETSLEPRALRAAGLSLRAVALATGVPRSTLHDQLSTHR